jgi:Methyltransferase domain
LNTFQDLLLAGILAIAGATLVVAVYVLHRTRRVHLKLFEVETALRTTVPYAISANFRQIESLYSIYREVPLEYPLPWTRGWAASPDFLWTVAQHALTRRPKVIVECSSGVSTVVLAACLRKLGTGHIWSLEHDQKFANQTLIDLERHRLTEFVTLVVAPLVPQRLGGSDYPWYDISTLPRIEPIELLVIDGPPKNTGRHARYPALPLLSPLLGSPATIFLDDSGRADEREILSRWMQEFPALQIESIPCEKGCVKIDIVKA